MTFDTVQQIAVESCSNDVSQSASTALCTGAQPREQPQERTLSDLKNEVNQELFNIRGSRFKIADSCAVARDRLTKEPDRWKEFLADLACDRSVFVKYAEVGSGPKLKPESIRARAPTKYSILYEFAKMTAEEFAAAQKENVFRSNVSREEVLEWVRRRRGVTARRSRSPGRRVQQSADGVRACRSSETRGDDKSVVVEHGHFHGAASKFLCRLIEEWEQAKSLRAVWNDAPPDARTQFVLKVLEVPISPG